MQSENDQRPESPAHSNAGDPGASPDEPTAGPRGGAPPPAEPPPAGSSPQPAPRSRLRRLLASRRLRVTLIVVAILAVAGSAAGAKGFHYVKTDPGFCAGTCHIMAPAADAWAHGPHKDVICQECHRADIFQEARLGWIALIERPEEVGPHTKLDARICAECHLSNDEKWRQVGATPGHRAHVVEKGLGCLECHVTKLHQFGADTAACERCHGADKLRLKKMSQLHCLGCHGFIGETGAEPTLIPEPSKCQGCHVEKADATPAIAATAPDLVGKPALVAEGHRACLGCHRPHGEPLDDPIDCLRCHRKLLEGGEHLSDERVTDCVGCHEPHSGRT